MKLTTGLGRDELKTWDAKIPKEDEHILVLANRYVSIIVLPISHTHTNSVSHTNTISLSQYLTHTYINSLLHAHNLSLTLSFNQNLP